MKIDVKDGKADFTEWTDADLIDMRVYCVITEALINNEIQKRERRRAQAKRL